MNKRIKKIVASAVCISMAASIAACSTNENRDHDGPATPLPSAASKPTETTEAPTDPTDTDVTDTTDTTATSADVTVAPTTAPGSGQVTISSDLTYPDHIPTYDEVHPAHEPGDIKGQEASDLLEEVEHDMLAHGVDNYFDAVILFEHPENYGITVDDVSWGDLEYDHNEEIAFYEFVAEKLYSIDYEDLDFQDRVFYDKVLFDIEESLYALQYTAFDYYESALNPLTSFQNDVLFLLEVLPINTVEDAEKYIELVIDTERYMAEICQFEADKAEYGMPLSADTYEAIAETFDDLVDQTDTCFLYESFNNKLSNISGLADSDRLDLINRHYDAMTQHFFPAMEASAESMRALKSYNAEAHGLSDYPGGDAYYASIIRRESNNFSDPEECLDRATQAFEDLMTETMTISTSGNYDINEYIDPPYSMGDMRANLDYLYEKIQDDFPALHEHSYFTMDVPEEFEDSFSPAAFLGYHLDTYDSNMIITNNSGVDGTFGITCAHEGYPGHMFDSVYHREHDEHEYMYVFNSTGYSEGWATYVEGYSHKYFGTDEGARRLTQLDDEMNLYFGTVLDIGINLEGWDLDECADHISAILGYTVSPSGLEYVYNLLLSDPCYYAKYGLGFINTCDVINQLHADFPDATDLEIHTAYLDAQEGTFDQIYEHAHDLLEG